MSDVDPLEIGFSIDSAGAKELTDRISKLADAFDRLADQINKAKRAATAFHVPGGAGGGSGGSGARAFRPGGSPSGGPSYAVQQQMLSRLLRSVTPGGRGGFASVTSLLPLAARGLSAGGPLLLIGTAAVGAASALSKLTEQTAELGRAFANLQIAGGGTGLQTAKLSGLAASAGVSPSALGGDISSFKSQIRSDPFSAALAGRLGIHPYMGPAGWGNQNWGQDFQTAIESLRKLTPQARESYYHTFPQLQKYSGLIDMTDAQYQKVQENAAIRSRIFGPGLEAQAADFLSARGQFTKALEDFVTVLGSPMVTGFTNSLNTFATALEKAAGFFARRGEAPATKAVFGGGGFGVQSLLRLGPVPALATLLFEHFHGEGAGANTPTNANTAAIQKNTEAIDRNTQAYLDGIKQLYGHGERAEAALPSGISGRYLRMGLASGGFQLSPF